MKKFMFLVVAFLIYNQNGIGQINAGVGLTYKLGKVSNLVGVQAKGLVNVAEKWKVAPAYSYYFGDNASYAIDADVQYDLVSIGDNFNLHPFIGLNWSEYGGNSDIGFNLGLFSDFRVNDGKLHVYVEPKYLISDAQGFLVSLGVMF